LILELIGALILIGVVGGAAYAAKKAGDRRLRRELEEINLRQLIYQPVGYGAPRILRYDKRIGILVEED
jgi:hypothetical protein